MASSVDCEDVVSPKLRLKKARRNSVENAQKEPINCIMCDWDDTLLPSTFLASFNCLRLDCTVPAEVDAQVKAYSSAVVTILQLLLQHGRVYIVSNSEDGWVKLSCQKFMPDVWPLLQQCTCISARTTYENQYPNATQTWKKLAMMDCINESYDNCFNMSKHIMSFGDSNTEREAVLACGKELSVMDSHVKTTIKSVKFVERPSVDQLRTELELVGKCFSHILEYAEALDLCLKLEVCNTP